MDIRRNFHERKRQIIFRRREEVIRSDVADIVFRAPGYLRVAMEHAETQVAADHDVIP